MQGEHMSSLASPRWIHVAMAWDNRSFQRRVALALAFVGIGSSVGGAQANAISPGTWGAEASSGPIASLLKFRSPTFAWLLGASALYSKQTTDMRNPVTGVTVTTTDDVSAEALRLGVRRYAQGSGSVRPFSTLAVLAGYDKTSLSHGFTYGGAGELGATYFFSSHASLG